MAYAVDTVRDDAGALRDRLHEIAEGGARVVSIMWQPTRTVTMHGSTPFEQQSGYVIVSEYEAVHAPRP